MRVSARGTAKGKKMGEDTVKDIFRINSEVKKRFTSLLEKRWGEPYRRYRRNWQEAGNFELKTDFPIHIDFDTIDSCNLHCLYCTEEHGYIRKRTHKRLQEPLAKRLFDEIRSPKGNDRLCSINIGTLGEPLMNLPMVYKLLEKSNEVGVMEKFLHTNAQLLTTDIFKRLAELDLTYLFFSLDAARPETYRKMRGAELSKAVEAILKVIEYRRRNKLEFPVMRVSFLKTETSKDEENEFIEFWKDKVDFVDIQPVCDFTAPRPEPKDLKYSCAQSYQRITLGVQGEIGLCCAGYIMRPEFYVGFFPEMSIYEAWNCEKARSLRAAHKRQVLDDFPLCLECLARLKV